MQATSTWGLVPELREAFQSGLTAEEWIGDRTPVCAYCRIGEDRGGALHGRTPHRRRPRRKAPRGRALPRRGGGGLVASPGGEDEVPSIRERVARSVRDRAREGKQSGGHRRFGWLPADRQLARPHNHELDQREATYLRAVIDMALSGKSERTLTQWLISEGVTTVKGGRWTSTTARNMITNPAICGYRALDGAIVLDPELGEPKGGRLGDDRHA